MGTTPPTYACAVRFMNFGAETKFEKGASDRNSLTIRGKITVSSDQISQPYTAGADGPTLGTQMVPHLARCSANVSRLNITSGPEG